MNDDSEKSTTNPEIELVGVMTDDVAILKPERTEYGKAIRSDYEKGKVTESRHNMTELQPRKDGLTNTITTVPKDNLLVEGKVDFIKWPTNTQKGFMEAHEGDGIVMQRPHAARGTVQPQTSPTLTTQIGGGSGVVVAASSEESSMDETGEDEIMWPSLNGPTKVEDGDGVIPSRPFSTRKSVMKDGVSFSIAATATPAVAEKVAEVESGRLCIRYLTPRECLRLMGQSEDAIDKIMAAEPSKTRQYKMAGNSIVVDVLVDIFKGIYIDKTFGKCERRPSLEDFL